MKKLITICLFISVSFIINAQEQKDYYENGELKSIGNFTNGKANGVWKFYYLNGQLKQIANYIDDKGVVELKNYHENGRLSQIGNIIDNKNIGEWKFYNENGELIAKILYNVDGKETTQEQKEYYTNGKLKSIGKIIDDKRNGEWIFYHENGQLSSTGNFTNDSRNSEWKSYYENGNLNEIGNFINDKQTGEWKKFNENRELIATKLMDDKGIEIKKQSSEVIKDEIFKELKTELAIKENQYSNNLSIVVDDFLKGQDLRDLDNGIKMLDKKDYKNAIIVFNNYIKTSFNPKKGYFYRGKANYEMKKYEEAITDFDAYFSIKDTLSTAKDAYFFRGCAKIELKQKDSGCLDLYKARDLSMDKNKAQDKINEYCN